jgi:hypothetical protein
MRVLITAGPVYAHLDDNKILSNMARGEWARNFSDFLALHRHQIHLMDNMEYWTYKRRCEEEAKRFDAAVMTAAVINYLPEKPFQGKMPTDLDTVNIKLTRSPYVIDEMRKVNPNLKLIGCKLTSREPIESTIEKAQHLIQRSKAHAVVANDKTNLRLKLLCFPDGTVIHYDDDFDRLYEELELMITDEHFHTVEDRQIPCPESWVIAIMENVLDRYRPRFLKDFAGQGCAFGSIAVRDPVNDTMLVTPRTKSSMITANQCVVAKADLEERKVTVNWNKATVNAPLLWKMLKNFGAASAILHLHEDLPGVPTVDYAPPGTVRDSDRRDLPPAFNIRGHGFVACLNRYGDILV